MWRDLKNADANNLSPEEAMILQLVCLQGVSINQKTITTGIGGFFNGIMLNAEGVNWIPDTFYFLYSAKHFDKSQKYGIHKFNRDEATFVSSKENRIFTTELSLLSDEELSDKWENILRQISRNYAEKYFICISYNQANAVIIDTTKDDSPIKVDPLNKKFKFSEWAISWMFYNRFREQTEPKSFYGANNFYIKNVLSKPN